MPYSAIGGQIAGQLPLVVQSKVTLDVTKAAFGSQPSTRLSRRRRTSKSSRKSRRSALGGTSPF